MEFALKTHKDAVNHKPWTYPQLQKTISTGLWFSALKSIFEFGAKLFRLQQDDVVPFGTSYNRRKMKLFYKSIKRFLR